MQSLFAQWECRAGRKQKGREGERPLGIWCFSSCQQLEEGVDLGKVRLRALQSRVGSQFCNLGLIHEPNLISIRHSQREGGEGEQEREGGKQGERRWSSKDHHQKAIDRHKEDRRRCSTGSRD